MRHMSWSSKYEPSLHLKFSIASRLSPGTRYFVTSNSTGVRLSLPNPTFCPFSHRKKNEFTPSNVRNTRRPDHSLGTLNVRRYALIVLFGSSSGMNGGLGSFPCQVHG